MIASRPQESCRNRKESCRTATPWQISSGNIKHLDLFMEYNIIGVLTVSCEILPSLHFQLFNVYCWICSNGHCLFLFWVQTNIIDLLINLISFFGGYPVDLKKIPQSKPSILPKYSGVIDGMQQIHIYWCDAAEIY